MPKVIQRSKKRKINLELHRGLGVNTSDPYKNRSSLERKGRKLIWTLVSAISRSRCSSTFIKSQRNLRITGAVSSIALILIISLTFVPVSTKTNEVDAATTGTESSTTVTVNQGTASVNLTAASADGTFATSTGAGVASFSVRTTNKTGYTLTIKEDQEDQNPGKLVNDADSSSYFDSISQVLDEKAFDTSTYNGKWGYKPSKYNSVTNVAYWPTPTASGAVLDVTEDENSSTDNIYTIALGARADHTQKTGVYSKTMVLTATANQAAYSITYSDDTGDTSVKNLPDATTGGTTATAITLSSVTPSRTGYVFDGWCSIATTDSGKTCPTGGTKYSAGGSYGIDQTTTNIVTLHAVWRVPTYTAKIKTSTGISKVKLGGTECDSTSGCNVAVTYGTEYALTATAATGYTFSSWYVNGVGNVGEDGAAGVSDMTSASTKFKVEEGTPTITAIARYTMPANVTMQTFTSQMCAAMPEEQPYMLTDSRDNTMYAVAKLKDGKCWMLQNLKLGSKSDNIVLTSADSAVSTNFTLSSNEAGADKFPYVDRDDDTKIGNKVYVKDKSEYYCTNDYGCYYNWYTATAGTGKGEGSAATGSDVTVSSSICPKGWNLPTGGSGSQFEALSTAYGGTSAAAAAAMLVADPATAKENINGSFAPGFLYGGHHDSGGAHFQGTNSFYWSRTAYSIGHGRSLGMSNLGNNALAHDDKYRGFAVRCLLQ